jgi:hypothetical protein
MARKVTAVLVGTLVLLGGNAGADEANPFLVGNKVRVRVATTPEPVVGRVVATTEETLTLVSGDQPFKVSMDQITAAEVSVARKSNWLKGTLIGAGAGAALGLILYAAAGDDGCSSDPDDVDYEHDCVDGPIVAVTTFGGAFWGAIIGHFVKRDVWAPMDLKRVQVTLSPARRGAGLNVSLRF